MADISRLETAFRAAHAAGDTASATRLAQEIRSLQSQPAQAQAQPESPKADTRSWQEMLRDDFKNQSGVTQSLVGAGTALSNLWEGAKQFVNADDQDTVKANKVFASEAPASALAGNVALFAPTALIPGANTVTGAGVIGAATGALQPSEGDSYGDKMGKKAINAAIGGATGSLVQKGANALSNKLVDDAAQKLALRTKNASRDQVIDEASKAGYKLTPAVVDSSFGARLLNGISGKIKTNQAAQLENQKVTDTLARRALGLSDDANLDDSVFRQIRNDAYNNGYEPVRNSGMVQVDRQFQDDLQKMIDNNVAAARDFGEVADDPIMKVAQDVGDKVMSTGAFDAKSGIAKIRMLRDAADDAYRKGDTTLGKANKQAASALEGLIERSLQSKGQAGAKMLDSFREARKLIAKSHTVEGAMQGSHVNAARIGSRVQKGKPLSDELETIGKFQQEFRDLAATPNSGASLPFSPLDAYAGAGTGIAGSLMTGNLLGLAAGLAVPATRIGSRALLMSKPIQKRLATQDYNPTTLASLLDSVASSRYLPMAVAQGAVKTFGQ